MNNVKPVVIAIACDHAGLKLKEFLIDYLRRGSYQVVDLGTNTLDSVDYPDYANVLADAILNNSADTGILVCGSGIGVSIAANRHNGIRAALVNEINSARLCRLHNDANVIAFGARVIEPKIAIECLEMFLSTEFEGGRHIKRLNKLDNKKSTYN
ncbi:MAG: ribose 5-phosphate isomerase B [Pseudomonadota bacterium]|nr:ribose 5-phosphate isomerase B [Pseudomonadota bacterium]